MIISPMWDKQSEMLSLLQKRSNKGGALLCDPGTGKSRPITHWMEDLFSKGARLAFICAPISVVHTWIETWDLWAKAPILFIDLRATGSVGLEKAVALSKEGYPVICLVNYDSTWRIGYKYKEMTHKNNITTKEFKKVGLSMEDVDWDIGILDESQKIKNRSSKASMFIRKKLRDKVKYRAILSGSSYIKRPLDVWAQLSFLCRDEVVPLKYEEFYDIVAIRHPVIRGATIGYKNLEWLAQQLHKVGILIKKEDMEDLPPFIHETRLVELCPKSRKIYDTIKEKMYVEFSNMEQEREEELLNLQVQLSNAEKLKSELTGEDLNNQELLCETLELQISELKATKAVTAEHIFSRIVKFRQITSGYITVDNDDPTQVKETLRLGNEKISALTDFLEDREDKPTIIVVQTNEEERIVSEAIEHTFKIKPKILNGSVKGAERRYQMIGEAANDPFFIVKESVACEGIDLRWSDCICFYSHSYSTSNYVQMCSRNHRGGVKHDSILYVHFIAEDTYDIRVMRALEKDIGVAMSLEKNWRDLF